MNQMSCNYGGEDAAYSSYLNVPEALAAVLGGVTSHAFVTVTNTIGLRLVSL